MPPILVPRIPFKDFREQFVHFGCDSSKLPSTRYFSCIGRRIHSQRPRLGFFNKSAKYTKP
ncbi:hypothetical protein EYF80_024688 [Liparis tanakae]|uniref:Uncharacterized protein n=1 Tax=Liparis tanakae TaxID=230148 RepID=A0A4Z2HGT1_9TELE|nr:hypothetical protein EYF80_024688 [Liparis tanakae]